MDENHPEYFFDNDYPNPFGDEDLDPDGPPSFNGATGTYTQTYDNGQIIVTYQDEDGPYRIRWYDQDEDGDNYLALDLNYDADDYTYDVYRYPIDYFDHVEDDFTLQAIDHYEDLAYLGIPPDDVDILDHQVQYIWYDEDGGYAQITRVDRATGEINYQYGPLFITVDQDGNQSYTGTPDPNWAPPEGYEPPPIDENHEPYFFEDYLNPLYGNLEADGPPSFNGATGTYTETYGNGQIVVTYQNEGGPYRIRWYDQDEDGDNYLALDINYDADDYTYDVYRYPYDYFDHVEDDFTLQAIDHYEDLAYLGDSSRRCRYPRSSGAVHLVRRRWWLRPDHTGRPRDGRDQLPVRSVVHHGGSEWEPELHRDARSQLGASGRARAPTAGGRKPSGLLHRQRLREPVGR